MINFISFMVGVAFVYIGVRVLEGIGDYLAQLLEMIKGKLIIKTAQYHKIIHQIEESFDEDDKPKQSIGFYIGEDEDEKDDELEGY